MTFDSDALTWVKANASTSSGNCVEMAAGTDGDVLMRNSRHPETVLSFTPAEISAFMEGAKAGEFDHLV